jgi:hypothetical protein
MATRTFCSRQGLPSNFSEQRFSCFQSGVTELSLRSIGFGRQQFLVVFSFWMGRASMTASGGFNCCYSLTLTGAALAFFTLGLGTQPSSRTVMILCGVIAGGFLASFSFGVGLATWVTAIAMAYALRLRLKVLIVLGIAGGLAALIFLKLPSREAAARLIAGKGWTDPSTYLQLASYFFSYAWQPANADG